MYINPHSWKILYVVNYIGICTDFQIPVTNCNKNYRNMHTNPDPQNILESYK